MVEPGTGPVVVLHGLFEFQFLKSGLDNPTVKTQKGEQDHDKTGNNPTLSPQGSIRSDTPLFAKAGLLWAPLVRIARGLFVLLEREGKMTIILITNEQQGCQMNAEHTMPPRLTRRPGSGQHDVGFDWVWGCSNPTFRSQP